VPSGPTYGAFYVMAEYMEFKFNLGKFRTGQQPSRTKTFTNFPKKFETLIRNRGETKLRRKTKVKISCPCTFDSNRIKKQLLIICLEERYFTQSDR